MKHDANLKAAAGQQTDVVFVVTVDLKPGCEQEFLSLLTPVLDAMRHEPTFINAVLHRDPNFPTRFMLYETWADLDDVVEVQIQRDYRKAYWDRLPDLLREPRQIQTWKPLRQDFAALASPR